MLARIRKAMEEREEGFTLIELLVVMIIIGILAAIAIPVFLSQKKKAYETSLKADLTEVATNIATAQVDNPATITVTTGSGPITITSQDGSTPANTLGTYNVSLSGGNSIVSATVTASSGAYCIEEQHTTGDPHWAVHSDGSSAQQLGQGTCSGVTFAAGG